MAKQPRFYQVEAKEAAITAIKSAVSQKKQARVIIDAAAGAGKTFMMADIAKHVYDKGGRVLLIARQPILAKQDYDEMLELGIPAAMYSAKFNCRQVSQVTVGTEGTIVNGLETDFTKPFDLCLLEECHQCPIEDGDSQFMRIINHVDSVAKRHGKTCHFLGYSGSPFRGNSHLEAFDFWQETVYDIGVDRLTDMGFLSVPVFGYPDDYEHSFDFSTLKEKANSFEFDEAELNNIVMSDSGKKKLLLILSEIIEKTKNRNSRIIFASTKRHAREIKKALIMLGIDKSKIGVVTDDSSEAEKDAVIAGSKSGVITWLINVSVLTTGFNSPLIDVVIFLRPISTITLLLQTMGRGARLLEEWMKEMGYHKENYLVLDYGGVFDRLGHLYDDPMTGAALAAKPLPNGELPLECPRCATMNGKKARRCRGKDSTEYDGRCGFFYISQTCAKCGTENDIAANVCRNTACQHELIDPNKKLLNTAYTDDQLVDVASWEITPAENGNGIMIKFNLKNPAEHGSPFVFYPTNTENAKRVVMKEVIEVYCRNPNWHKEFKAQINPKGIMKLKQALTMPRQIAYRINGANKFVIGRKRFA